MDEASGAEALAAARGEVRVLFYVTFRKEGADAEALGNPSAYSLLSRYRGRFTLGELCRLANK